MWEMTKGQQTTHTHITGEQIIVQQFILEFHWGKPTGLKGHRDFRSKEKITHAYDPNKTVSYHHLDHQDICRLQSFGPQGVDTRALTLL